MEAFAGDPRPSGGWRSTWVTDLRLYLVLQLPVVLFAAFALVPVDLHPVLLHQQQVPDQGLEVGLGQDHALQPAATCAQTRPLSLETHLDSRINSWNKDVTLMVNAGQVVQLG